MAVPRGGLTKGGTGLKHKTRIAGLSLALAVMASALTGCQFEDQRSGPVENAMRGEEVPGAEEPLAAQEIPEEVPQEISHEISYEGYINGNNGFFQPEKICTRAEIAQILCNLGISAPDGKQFSDVEPAAWYAPAVTQLAGILHGYDDGTLRPFQEISQAELLAILCRAMDVEVSAAAEGQAWYAPIADAAEERGWLEGLPRFAPDEGADRAAVVMICNRAIGRTPDRAAIDRIGETVFLDLPRDHFAYYDVLEAALDHSEDWSGVEIPAIEPGLHVLDGAAYLVKKDGTVDETPGLRKLENAFCLISEDHGRVYADEAIHMADGRPVFCTAQGTLLQDGEWHGFHFDAEGRYTSGDAELDRYVESILKKNTKPDMTQEEMLYACNCVIRAYAYLGRNAAYPGTVKLMPHADAVEFAKKIFETGKGDCYNFAAAYYFCAKRLGLDASAVVGRCAYVRWGPEPYPHAWLEIPIEGKTFLFDAQIENNNIRNGVSNEEFGVFKSTYETAPAVYIKN